MSELQHIDNLKNVRDQESSAANGAAADHR